MWAKGFILKMGHAKAIWLILKVRDQRSLSWPVGQAQRIYLTNKDNIPLLQIYTFLQCNSS